MSCEGGLGPRSLLDRWLTDVQATSVEQGQNNSFELFLTERGRGGWVTTEENY